MSEHWLQTSRGFRRTSQLPLSDRGFRYGMAVFETLRVDGGRLRFSAEHLASLREACQAARFPMPDEDLARAFEFLAKAGEGTGVARVHVTAGDGGPGDPALACRLLISFERRAAALPASYRLRTSGEPHHPFFGGRKTHNYWPQTAALQTAGDAGADETLLFDANGRLISAAMANVFVVDEKGAILTPALELGARAGVVRGWVCRQRVVAEGRIDAVALRRAKEVFLTNSWIGILPAASLDGRPFPGGTAAAALQSLYERDC